MNREDGPHLHRATETKVCLGTTGLDQCSDLSGCVPMSADSCTCGHHSATHLAHFLRDHTAHKRQQDGLFHLVQAALPTQSLHSRHKRLHTVQGVLADKPPQRWRVSHNLCGRFRTRRGRGYVGGCAIRGPRLACRPAICTCCREAFQARVLAVWHTRVTLLRAQAERAHIPTASAQACVAICLQRHAIWLQARV